MTANFVVVPGPYSVEAWSVERIQFPPRGWQAEFRDRLAEDVGDLDIPSGAVLHAEYRSEARDFCDVENVLFYNIGARPFTQAARRGLRFERAFGRPSSSIEVPEARHYYWYRAGGLDEGFRTWERVRTLVEWEAGPFVTLGELGDLATVWYRVREGRVRLGVGPLSSATPFGIKAIIHSPAGRVPRPAGLVKGLLDGIVAAFHSHDGSAIDVVTRRLARKLPLTPEGVAVRLMDPQRSVLGQRNLVRPRAPDSVHWYPGDDLCFAGEVLTEPARGNAGWYLSGAIFELRPRSVPG